MLGENFEALKTPIVNVYNLQSKIFLIHAFMNCKKKKKNVKQDIST